MAVSGDGGAPVGTHGQNRLPPPFGHEVAGILPIRLPQIREVVVRFFDGANGWVGYQR